MFRIAKSLVMILAVAAVAAGATSAYFTDRATISNNTFSTGVLEIRINGLENRAGFNYTNAVPGDVASYTFSLQNYGLPWFPSGPSTLPAKDLLASVSNATGDGTLYGALVAKLYANAGWGGCSNPGTNPFVAGKGCTVYNGPLSAMSQADILMATQWGAHPDLIPGNSFSMLLEVELPNSGDQSALMGKSTSFDIVVDAYNPRITP